MELTNGVLHIASFLAVTIGIIVLFVGKRINDKVGILRELSIPEPVTGGLLFSILFGLLYLLSGVEVDFALRARDVLLVYFFTTIGINASARDLLAGGRPLVILLAITVTFMLAQNLTGIAMANLLGLPSAVGVLGGSVSLIGGHGTAIAWSPTIGADQGIPNAMEIGIASATFGLILASIMGGPIAKFLINRHGHGQHGRGHPALRAVPPRLHHRPSGLCILHRPGQRHGDPVLPPDVLSATDQVRRGGDLD